MAAFANGITAIITRKAIHTGSDPSNWAGEVEVPWHDTSRMAALKRIRSRGIINMSSRPRTSMSSPAMARVVELVVHRGTQRVLDEVSELFLKVVAIMGENGSGKTTLIEAFAETYSTSVRRRNLGRKRKFDSCQRFTGKAKPTPFYGFDPAEEVAVTRPSWREFPFFTLSGRNRTQ